MKKTNKFMRMARPELEQFTVEEIRDRAKLLRFYADQADLLAETARQQGVERPFMGSQRGFAKSTRAIANWLATGVRHLKKTTRKEFPELGDGDSVYLSKDGRMLIYESEPIQVAVSITGNNRKRSKSTGKDGKKQG